MESSALQQIITQDNIPFRLYINLLENSVEIILFQDQNAWKSTVMKEKLHYFAEEYKLNLQDYCSKLLDYVKDTCPTIVYVFEDEEFAINRVLENSLMVKYFACKMERVNYVSYVEQIMDKLYSENRGFCDDLLVLQKEKEELIKNKNDCESKLQLLTNQKIADESELYGRFVLVLNEKKRRIQHLTELLDAFKNGRPVNNPEVKVANKKRKKEVKNTVSVQRKETISESESSEIENCSDTDEAGSGEHTPLRNSSTEKIPSEESKPSTSAGDFDFLEDDFDQSHILPKRVKHAEVSETVVVAPAQTKMSPKREEPIAEASKSPEIDLSTQQLLDML